MSVAASSPATSAPGFGDDATTYDSPDSQPYATAATSSPRLVRFARKHQALDDTSSGSYSTVPSLTSASTFESKLDLSPSEAAARKGVLKESFVPIWKDDAATSGLADPAEMQRQDPLMSQVWKLYSKAKTQLPNAERMENLTWRMMAMNLRRREMERRR